MWYIVLNSPPDAKEGTVAINLLYANVVTDRWSFSRRLATHWQKKEDAEAAAMRAVVMKPDYIQRITVRSFPKPRQKQ